MSEFAILHTEMWRDPAFTELSPDARLLFLWAWTSPEAAICGLYTTSEKRMRQALGQRGVWGVDDKIVLVGARRITEALDQLAEKPLVLWDEDAEVLWVPARAARSNRSPKAAAVMVKEFRRCPPSPLKDAFAARYPGLVRGA